MLTTKNGWHYDSEKEEYILDERGEKIPEQVCYVMLMNGQIAFAGVRLGVITCGMIRSIKT